MSRTAMRRGRRALLGLSRTHIEAAGPDGRSAFRCADARSGGPCSRWKGTTLLGGVGGVRGARGQQLEIRVTQRGFPPHLAPPETEAVAVAVARDGKTVGRVLATFERDEEILHDVGARLGLTRTFDGAEADDPFWCVEAAEVDGLFQGTGLGTVLYYALQIHVLPDTLRPMSFCGGTTSASAERIWRSGPDADPDGAELPGLGRLARRGRRAAGGRSRISGSGSASRTVVGRQGQRAKMTLNQALKTFKRLGGDLSDTSPGGLKSAYRALALKLHPDRRQDEPAVATKEMQDLNGAYTVIAAAAKDQLAGFSTESGHLYEGFDHNAWYEQAMADTRASFDAADDIIARWYPSSGSGVTHAQLDQWANDALAHGFVRVQLRDYSAHDPALNIGDLLVGGMFSHTGYHGGVAKTRTLRGKNPHPDDLVKSVLDAVSASAHEPGWAPPRQGRPPRSRGWKGSPLDLIYRLIIVEPVGQNPGHAAVAWTTAQSWDAVTFGGGRTRWYSLSVAPRPAKKPKKPKGLKWDHGMARERLRQGGLVHLGGSFRGKEKWGLPGTVLKRHRHIILNPRSVRESSGSLVYFGELSLETLDTMIRWAGGTPKGAPPGPTPPPPPVPEGQWVRVEPRRGHHPAPYWYEAVVNGHHLNASPGYSGNWYAFTYTPGVELDISVPHNRSRWTPNDPRKEVQELTAAWARAQPTGDAPLLDRKKLGR